MRQQFIKDENFGKKYEDLLQEYFDSNLSIHGKIVKTKKKYATIDYINEEWICELKSRRYSINSFASFGLLALNFIFLFLKRFGVTRLKE